jgi:hypothetical protein
MDVLSGQSCSHQGQFRVAKRPSHTQGMAKGLTDNSIPLPYSNIEIPLYTYSHVANAMDKRSNNVVFVLFRLKQLTLKERPSLVVEAEGCASLARRGVAVSLPRGSRTAIAAKFRIDFQ